MKFGFALLVSTMLAVPIPVDARVIHSETSLYQNILVTQDGTLRCMQFTIRKDHRNQSCVDSTDSQRLVFAYTRMMLAALLLDPSPTRILIVGLGGGTLPTTLAQLYPDAHIDVIELDPAVVKVARAYFDFAPSANMRVFEQDARVWVKRAAAAPTRYDLIMLDAFNGEYIPEHLMTREYLLETRELLVDGGVLASNTFAISRLYHNESVTYAEVFGIYYNLRSSDSANRVIIARRGSLLDPDTLARAAIPLTISLAPYGVPIESYPAQFATKPDWDTDARVLTDQYSPANLLKGRH